MGEQEEVTADEIRAGLSPAESSVILTEAHRQVWDDLVDQIRAL